MAMTGFKAYRRKGGDIEAQPMEGEFSFGDQTFKAGDYLVKDSKGGLDGASKEEFEANFELVKKNYNKPKTKKTPAEAAGEAAKA